MSLGARARAPVPGRPLRVLHASAGNLYGGVETMLTSLARTRAAAPWMEPEFAVCFEGRLARELREAQVPVHELGAVRVSRPWQVLLARRRLAALVRARGIDVVVCHASWAHAVLAPAVRAVGAGLVFFLHDVVDGRHWLDRWARWTPPDLIVANSRFTRASLVHLFPDSPAEVVHCPVDPRPVSLTSEEREALRAAQGAGPGDVVILQVSRMEPWKGQGLHLEALGRLRDKPGWVCWMVGGAQRPHEQAYLAQLRQDAERWGVVDRVRFLGQRSDVPRLLACADIFCQPNLGPEPFGISFVEALGAGLPVVSTAQGGALEVVDASCGLLVPPEPVAVASALASLVEDASRRQTLGAAGPARARLLTEPTSVLPRLAEVLARAQPGRPAGGPSAS